MLVYVITEISSGDVDLALDSQNIYCNKKIAESQFKIKYKTLLKSLKDYDLIDSSFDNDYYEIIIEDEDYNRTIYNGYIKEFNITIYS